MLAKQNVVSWPQRQQAWLARERLLSQWMHGAATRSWMRIPRMAANRSSYRGLLLLACGLLFLATCQSQSAVHVQKRGEAVVIDVDMPVPATPAIAWAVLTDYEHMATFLSNLTSSRVVKRQGETLQVAQSGRTKIAFMTFSFAVVRAVELTPMYEIRSSLVSGDFKSYVSTTRLIGLTQGVRVVHHGEYVLKAWLPPMVGVAVIESETRQQFDELSAEMLRRQAAQR
jgi:ribosome-associated toxin RatA of RatAB toxin-antitoxin module